MAIDQISMSAARNGAEAELRAFVHSIEFTNPASVTLTMKKRADGKVADAIIASANFRHFSNRLNHVIFGSRAKRYGAKLQMVVVLETSADNRLHFHCIIDRPIHCPFPTFAAIVREQWAKTVDIQDRPDEGWTDYLLKRRQKRSLFDSIDWANCQLIAE